jgi:hypothetical protein
MHGVCTTCPCIAAITAKFSRRKVRALLHPTDHVRSAMHRVLRDLPMVILNSICHHSIWQVDPTPFQRWYMTSNCDRSLLHCNQSERNQDTSVLQAMWRGQCRLAHGLKMLSTQLSLKACVRLCWAHTLRLEHLLFHFHSSDGQCSPKNSFKHEMGQGGELCSSICSEVVHSQRS